jgi:hypothetical protein
MDRWEEPKSVRGPQGACPGIDELAFSRFATRFEKLALNYLAMLKLAMIERSLRIPGLSDRV